ncbi:TonB-dependent receptor [Flavivirga aquimarina]|uniref:TonB-dependent receptor n=1 Tax=Flavivirga aquimarina TaxID=2027862 RepID=A0ABT8WCV1_9FLAO|nr:TonB-dependent receptor [Flavivirga aquimarina]MDO5970869.1 TonB-dependent receptor [Flavivirga aquimarina]
MKRIFILPLLLLFIVVSVSAQKTQLKGIVIDSITQETIPFATIAIYNKIKLVDGVSADENGKFQLNTSKVFTHLEVSFIGYETLRLMLSETENINEIIIALKLDITSLEEVIIKGKRTTTQLKIDRKIINLESDIQQSGVNALEAFDQIPEVQTDIGAGTVSLRGSDNVRVLINGKPSSFSATELLQQISASSIDHVEIITSPSAKHRADGISGIINLILKKERNSGFNLGLNTSIGTRRHSLGINGNYNNSSINFRVSASKSSNKETNNQTIHRQFSNGNTESVFTPYEFDGSIYKIASGLDFYIKDKHEFSFGFDYTDDSHNYENKSTYFNVSGRDNYDYLRENSHFHYVTIFNANYRLKFDNVQHFLEFDYNLNSSNNNYPIMDYEDGTFLFNQFLTEDFVLQSLALDYIFPINDKLIIESGISRNTQTLESQNLFSPVNDATTRNQFEYDESLLGLYGLCKFSLGEINLQAGLRYEYFKSNSESRTNNFKTLQEFSNLFPSVHLSYPINDTNTINLGYSKRVSRPNFHHINAFQIVNPLYVWEFNPNITPEISDNIEFTYQKSIKGFNLGITSFYRHRKNVILWTEFSENNLQVFRYENSGTFNSYGVETTVRYKLASFWNSRLSANYYFTKINQSSAVTWDRTYSSSIQFKNTFDISENLTADMTYLYTPKRQSTFNYVDVRNRLDFAISGRFLKNKLTANFRIVDIFNNNVLNRTSKTSNLTQNTNWDIQSQTLNYLFTIKYKLFKNKERTRSRKNRKYNDTPID